MRDQSQMGVVRLKSSHIQNRIYPHEATFSGTELQEQGALRSTTDSTGPMVVEHGVSLDAGKIYLDLTCV